MEELGEVEQGKKEQEEEEQGEEVGAFWLAQSKDRCRNQAGLNRGARDTLTNEKALRSQVT